MAVQDLTACIVQITSTDSPRFGTGFVIFTDQQNAYVITCAHVIEDLGGEGTTILANGVAAVLVASDKATEGIDLAILRIDMIQEISVLSPGRASNLTGNPFRCAGYYRAAKQNVAQTIEGVWGNILAIRSIHLNVQVNAWRLNVSNGDTLQDGYSGSPVLDYDGNVLGVVSCKEGDGERGFAIAIDALVYVWQDMPDALKKRLTQPFTKLHLDNPNSLPLMNLIDEIETFERLAKGDDNATQLIVVHGESGSGKSRLLAEYQNLAIHYAIERRFFNLGAQLNVEGILDNLTRFYGLRHFGNYYDFRKGSSPTLSEAHNWYENLTNCFFADLSALEHSRKLVILIDQYEKADLFLKNWLSRSFLPGIENQPIIVVVAGQDALPVGSFEFRVRQFHLKGVTDESYRKYADKCGVQISLRDIQFLHNVLRGLPKLFVLHVSTLMKEQK